MEQDAIDDILNGKYKVMPQNLKRKSQNTEILKPDDILLMFDPAVAFKNVYVMCYKQLDPTVDFEFRRHINKGIPCSKMNISKPEYEKCCDSIATFWSQAKDAVENILVNSVQQPNELLGGILSSPSSGDHRKTIYFT